MATLPVSPLAIKTALKRETRQLRKYFVCDQGHWPGIGSAFKWLSAPGPGLRRMTARTGSGSDKISLHWLSGSGVTRCGLTHPWRRENWMRGLFTAVTTPSHVTMSPHMSRCLPTCLRLRGLRHQTPEEEQEPPSVEDNTAKYWRGPQTSNTLTRGNSSSGQMG